MKWSTLALVGVGIVAAFCAFLIVMGLRDKPGGLMGGRADEGPKKVNVVIAAQDLDDMKLVEADDLELATMPMTDKYEEYVTDPTHAVGKALREKAVKGQPLKKAHFADEESGFTVASRLKKGKEGKRAVPISLPDHASLEGLLYPGSVVDVLVSFRSGTGRADAIATTLMQKVTVLAVGKRTTLSKETGDDSEKSIRSRRKVTLLVDPEQAQALHLAMAHGTISLALRNPLDKTVRSMMPTQLATLAAGSYGPLYRPEPTVQEEVEEPSEKPATPTEETPAVAAPKEQEPETRPPLVHWRIDIIRGSARESQTFTGSGRGEM